MSEAKNECRICFDECMPEQECIDTLCCKQAFHKECIEQWTGTCPMCRGIWKEGLQPRTPVVTYQEDFTDTTSRHSVTSVFGGSSIVRQNTTTTISITQESQFYPNLPPTFTSDNWTTEYRSSYTNPR